MPYYILEKGFELCGWLKLPFALRYPMPEMVDFFDRESYLPVLRCNGQCDIDESEFTEKQKAVLKRLIDLKIAIPCKPGTRLEPWQEYKSYPNMFKKHVQWSITGRCNYQCKHCFMSAPLGKFGEPTYEQCLHVIDELEKCGVRSVGLTGGEPMVNGRMMDIVRELAKRRIQTSTIYSNGKLVTPELLDELEACGQKPKFQMSYDGLGWHDWLRGIDGAEEDVLRAFRLLKDRGFSTSAAMCLHRHNIATVRESVNLLASVGCSSLKINVASPMGNWANEKEHFITNAEAYQAMLDYIPQYFEDGAPLNIQMCILFQFDREPQRFSIPTARYSGTEKSRRSPSCGAIKRGIYISPEGMVLPCMTMAGTAVEHSFTSVYERSLSDILSDSMYSCISRMRMGEVTEHNCKCRECKYRDICGGGCRAIACGESCTDLRAIDNDACEFFTDGWYDRIIGFMERYDDEHGTDYTWRKRRAEAAGKAINESENEK